MKRSALLLSSALGATLLAPAAAGAATKVVTMGIPTQKIAKQFQKLNGDVNAFFPTSLTIHAGDRVQFVPVGFHNIDFPAKGGTQAPLLAEQDTVTADNDAGGAPFWFNGQKALGFNPVLFSSAFGKKVTLTSKGFNSGLPLAAKPKPVVVTFPKAGSYTYYCDVHPGMKATVKVVGKAKKVPSLKADAKRMAAEASSDYLALKNLAAYKPGSGVIQIGGAGKNGVESYNFFPAATSVKVGDTITFKMPTLSREDHTATTGPGDPEKQPDSYLGKLAASFNAQTIDPAATYASEQPGGSPAALTPTLHGNGFWNSGVLDAAAATPLPPSNQVTFAAAGTYSFYCLIHPFMKATVTVTQ